MKLYHGSPKKLKVLKPIQAKGTTNYENLKAVFLTSSLKKAKRYAVSKHLKGKTGFAISKRLTIVGEYKISRGYVYEFRLPRKSLIKGDQRGEWAIQEPIKPINIHEIKEFKEKIQRVKTKKELIESLKLPQRFKNKIKK